MKNLTIELAKQFLKENGYFTDNLWSIHDVKKDYECTDEEAQAILSDVLNSSRIKEEINDAIDITASSWDIAKKGSNAECEDCGDEYPEKQLLPYKYEPNIRLCENCLESRMDE